MIYDNIKQVNNSSNISLALHFNNQCITTELHIYAYILNKCKTSD